MNKQVGELLQQMLETELGGVKIYETALQCVVNEDLKEEWTKYLEQTKKHVGIMHDIFGKVGLAEEDTPGRMVVRHIGELLVGAMKLAQQAASRRQRSWSPASAWCSPKPRTT